MKIGTKSVLFGVHQFLWHPWTVALTWRQLYGGWPKWWEWVAIFCHDLGYIGCPDMDGEIGQLHPVFGAKLADELVRTWAAIGFCIRHPFRSRYDEPFIERSWRRSQDLGDSARRLVLGHSRFYAKKMGIPTSELFRPDKLCVRFDPEWFYLLRATLSGEIWEFIANAPDEGWEDFQGSGASAIKKHWSRWYRRKVEEKFA